MTKKKYLWEELISYIKGCLIFAGLWRFIRRSWDEFFRVIDIVVIEISNCKLRCAMCPRGCRGFINTKKGMMDLELFKKVIDKFVAEKLRINNLWFGSWGESLLNPFFPEMVRYAKNKVSGIKIFVNTNLTCLKDPAAIIDSGLDCMRVSLSGMSQDIYSKNHIGGDVNTVLSNFKKMVYFKKQLKNDIDLIMAFHDYVYNKKDADLARSFCENNGIKFILLRCFISSVEANIQFHKDKEKMSKFYGQFIDLEREQRLMHTLKDYRSCWMNRMVAIDFDGQLCGCCGFYEEKYFLGSLFDYKIREIEHIKSKICELCIKTPISWR